MSDSISLDNSVSPVLPLREDSTLARVTFQPHVEESIDTLEGELVSFDEESVKVKTWYAGDLTLRRSMLKQIEVDGGSAPLLHGPGSIDDWNQIGDKGAWSIDAGVLHCEKEGTVARDFGGIPDSLHLSFDLEFESSPFLRIFFFANSGVERLPTEAYSIQIARSQMTFLKRVDNKNIPLNLDIMRGGHNFDRNQTQSIDLYADRNSGVVALYIDGEAIVTARDQDPTIEGSWWLFENKNGRVQSLKNFTLRSWDGKLPEKSASQEFRDQMEGEGQAIELQNGDTILGTAQTIEDGKLSIETEYIPISIPIQRLKSFEITSEEDGEGPRIFPGGVRAYFLSGGFVSFRLSDITPTTISGYSQVFGDATFDLRAFSHINFNPYDEDFRERRGEVN